MKSAKFCKLKGISRQTLSRWRAKGYIKVTSSGEIDEPASAARLAAAGMGGRHTKPIGDLAGLAEAQRRREISLARLRRSDWRRIEGAWCQASDALAQWGAARAVIAERLGRIVNCAADIAAAPSLAAIRAIIEDVTHAALTDLAGNPPSSPPRRERARRVVDDLNDRASQADAERIKIQFTTKLRDHELAVRDARVVEISKSVAVWGAGLARVRTRILSLPAEAPPRLFRRTVDEIEALLAAAIAEAVEQLPTAGAVTP